MTTIQRKSTCFVEVDSTRFLIEDGTLLGYLDGALGREVRRGVSDHLARCESCRQRLGLLERRMERLSRLLSMSDQAPSLSERNRAPSLRAAAAIILALGVGAFVSPARAWVVDLWTPSPDARSTVLPDVPLNADFSVVSFTVGSSLTVEFTTAQKRGELVLIRDDSQRAEFVAADPETAVVVSRGLLRITSADADGSYRLSLPTRVETIRLLVQGRPAQAIDMVAVNGEVTLGLDPR